METYLCINPGRRRTHMLDSIRHWKAFCIQILFIVMMFGFNSYATGQSISSFTATPATVARGASVLLKWSVSKTSRNIQYSLDQGVGSVSNSRITLSPTTTTTYTLTVTWPQNDGAASVVDTATCTVVVDQPPVIGAVSTPSIQAGRSFSFVLPEAVDPENETITYSVSGTPYGVGFNPTTRTVSGVVPQAGTVPFTYKATDNFGASSSVTVVLSVNPRQITQNDYTLNIQYGYDDQGRLSTITYPSGRVVTYTYDTLDRVNQIVQNNQTVIRQANYDSWGNRVQQVDNSGAVDQWTYDASGSRVTQWALGTVGATPSSWSYAYDAADRLTKAEEWTSLGYDANSRLTSAVGFGLTENYSHDAFDNNIVSVASTSAVLPQSINNYNFNPIPSNHLPGLTASGGLTQISEDNFGEITNLGISVSSSNALSMTWDGLGRMLSTRMSETGAVESYEYSAFGLRSTRIDTLTPGLNRIYGYTAGGMLLSEYSSNPTPAWSRDVIYLGGLAVAEIDASGVHELHSDHLGSPRVVTNSAGVPEGTVAYGPYGELIQQTGYVPLTGYTGHIQTEPTGLIYMRGRFYSPAWHRFMNSDQGVDPKNINQFAYVGGRPTMSTDPSGLFEPPDGPEGAIGNVGSHIEQEKAIHDWAEKERSFEHTYSESYDSETGTRVRQYDVYDRNENKSYRTTIKERQMLNEHDIRMVVIEVTRSWTSDLISSVVEAVPHGGGFLGKRWDAYNKKSTDWVNDLKVGDVVMEVERSEIDFDEGTNLTRGNSIGAHPGNSDGW